MYTRVCILMLGSDVAVFRKSFRQLEQYTAAQIVRFDAFDATALITCRCSVCRLILIAYLQDQSPVFSAGADVITRILISHIAVFVIKIKFSYSKFDNKSVAGFDMATKACHYNVFCLIDFLNTGRKLRFSANFA